MAKLTPVEAGTGSNTFLVYTGANPTASARFLVVGDGLDGGSSVNQIATIDMIVDMNFGGRIPQVKRTPSNEQLPTGPRSPYRIFKGPRDD